MNDNIRYSIYLVLVLVLVLVLTHYITLKKTYNEHFTNQYLKYEDTLIPGSMKYEPLKGTLDQAKDKCNNDDKCLGIVRKNGDEKQEDEYYIINNVDYCINQYNNLPEKEVEDKN